MIAAASAPAQQTLAHRREWAMGSPFYLINNVNGEPLWD